MASTNDPWAQLGDLDGREKYRVLQVSYHATAEEIKKAYRELAKIYHPDKGGNAAKFAVIQAAFETLSNRASRVVYDDWAKEVQFRYVPTRGQQAQGGEDVLLDELAGSGILCNPLTQLVVLCEVCGRPSTKECWTCKMPICSFCTLKRHWKDGFPLHWPLVNSDHMSTRLAKREFEKKRIEDARLLDMEDPNWRSEADLKDIRSFKTAAYKMQDCHDRLVRYDYNLARYYMWAQTQQCVYIAVHIPTGYQDRQLDVDCSEHVLRVQPQDSPPILERAFDGPVDTSKPVDTFRTKENRTLVIVAAKRKAGQQWPRLFRGDSDGLRCMQPLYRIAETERDVTIEADLPGWVQPDDVSVEITQSHLTVDVQGIASFRRRYWQPRDGKQRGDFEAVDVMESMWCLDEVVSPVTGKATKALLLSIVKPEATEEELTWKKGMRQDNLNADRPGSMTRKGFRFFEDDEDEYGLEEVLQAMCFLEVGETFVPAKPWQLGQQSRLVRDVQNLDDVVQKHLQMLLDEEERSTEQYL